jgi:hypothetical protein
MSNALSVVCLILAGASSLWAAEITIPAPRLQDQIRGGLLGHILGDLNGLKHEMKYIDEPGSVASYVPSLPDGAWTDDDTDVEWVYLLDMERSRTILLAPARIAGLWKRHVNRRIWCSHLYLRQLLDIGIEPPLTGSVHLNPWADFNLSAQFVSESWGLIAPGMPRAAARIGTHYTHVSIDGEPVQSTHLFTSMIATAFLTSHMDKILNAGVAAMDPSSDMRRAVLDVREWHKRHPQEWQTTRRLLKEKYARYGGHDMRDRNGVILNGASVIAALLYGKGDFAETARHAFNFGWDADNNAATACTVIGVIKGAAWMNSQGWQIKDVFRNTSRDEMPADETITKFGDRLIGLAEQVIAEQGGRKVAGGYRIRTETPAPLERLPDPARQFSELRARLKPEIETGIVRGSSTAQQQARAAYLAICLDYAASMKQEYPDAWARALRTLASYPKMLDVIYYQSGPAGEAIRSKAAAAGLAKPAAPLKFE